MHLLSRTKLSRLSLFRLDLNDRLDLDQSIQRQGVGTDGTSGMITDGLVKDLHNHIGTPVHNLMMELEIRRRVNNTKDLFLVIYLICSENENVRKNEALLK